MKYGHKRLVSLYLVSNVSIVFVMENRHKEINLLCMNFTKVEHVFVGSKWKRYKYFSIDGANAIGVKKWRLPSVRSKFSNITAN